MLKRLLFSLVVFCCARAGADAPAIDHQPVACVRADRFPVLEATFAPDQLVAMARVRFQPEGSRHWYGVAMKRTGNTYSATLPKPKKQLASYLYYLEVIDTTLATSRTSEYKTRVDSGLAACEEMKQATAVGSASVALEVPAGAPAVPAGFSGSGVTVVAAGAGVALAAGGSAVAATGGGIPTTALVIGGGLVAAGAGAAAVVAGSGDSGGGGDDSVTYSGPFNGQTTIALVFTNGVDAAGNSSVCGGTTAMSGTITITLIGIGAASGRVTTTGTNTPVSGTCPYFFPLEWGVPLTGSAGNLSGRSQPGALTGGNATIGNTFEFSGSLNAGVINGTLTFTSAHTGLQANGLTFAGNTSTIMPVTLR